MNDYRRQFLQTGLIILFSGVVAIAQQVADEGYVPEISQVEYQKDEGSVIFIDEGHQNFHTKDGRYQSFAKLLERDGYQLKGYEGRFERDRLQKGKILVISNAIHESNLGNWVLPNPSAFTMDEISILTSWVHEGGSLFLIADHMPMAGAASDLAAAFGFKFTNGFVFDTVSNGPAIFNRDNGGLHSNAITNGRNNHEKVDRIATFTGQAFEIPEDAKAILTFNEDFDNVLPDTAWIFRGHTPRHGVEGWSQGAYKIFGKGRVVVFGEAAMFTAQLAGPEKRKFGMNTEIAKENYQLALNIIHWLDHRFD